MTDFVADASRLFEFFTESTRLRIREQLSTDNYKDVEWLRDFPDSPAVRFPEPQEAEQTEYVLQVDKLPYNEPPVPDGALSGGLGHFDYRDPSQKPSFELPRPIDSDPDGHFDEFLTAEEEGRLTGLYEEWFSRWSSWAEGERPLKPVRDLYKSLHDIERQLSIQPENWDLVLGVGLLTMRRSDGDSAEVKLVKRHVFTHELRIALDYDTGTLEVTLSEGLSAFRIELDMIPPEVGPRRPDLDRMEEEFLNDVIHPLNLDGLDDLLESGRRPLQPIEMMSTQRKMQTSPTSSTFARRPRSSSESDRRPPNLNSSTGLNRNSTNSMTLEALCRRV